jgi:1-acyl-sn-glycerol-3-phosphate acyltransferase
MIRAIPKFIVFAFVLLIYFILSLCIYAICLFKIERARPFLTHLVSYVSKAALKIIGINVVRKNVTTTVPQHCLIVSNHLSYMDVFIISSQFPTCFVTSVEMKNTFFLGQLCMLGGCLFVDRKNRRNIHKEIRELTHALKQKLNVVVFPEATSTDGAQVYPFKTPMLMAALDSHSQILPLCLNYKKLDGEPVTLKNKKIVFWFGDQSFADHAIHLFAKKKVEVELAVLPVIETASFESKSDLAIQCHDLIQSHYKNII